MTGFYGTTKSGRIVFNDISATNLSRVVALQPKVTRTLPGGGHSEGRTRHPEAKRKRKSGTAGNPRDGLNVAPHLEAGFLCIC